MGRRSGLTDADVNDCWHALNNTGVFWACVSILGKVWRLTNGDQHSFGGFFLRSLVSLCVRVGQSSCKASVLRFATCICVHGLDYGCTLLLAF